MEGLPGAEPREDRLAEDGARADSSRPAPPAGRRCCPRRPCRGRSPGRPPGRTGATRASARCAATRPPADCFAPTMSWFRSARNFFSSPGWSAKYRYSARISSHHQNRIPRRGRGIFPSAISRVSARAISSTLATPDWSSLAENFSSWRCPVSTTSGSEGSVPGCGPRPSPTSSRQALPPRPRCGARRGGSLAPEARCARLALQPVGKGLPIPGGQDERERGLFAVGAVRGRARRCQAIWSAASARGFIRVEDHDRIPAAPRFQTAWSMTVTGDAVGEDDLAADVLPFVIGRPVPRPHVHELRRHVGRSASSRRSRSRPRHRSRASSPSPRAGSLEQPRFGAPAGPGGRVVDLVDPADVLEPGLLRLLQRVPRHREEALRAGRLVPLGRQAKVLEGQVARELVDERPLGLLVHEWRGLGLERQRRRRRCGEETRSGTAAFDAASSSRISGSSGSPGCGRRPRCPDRCGPRRRRGWLRAGAPRPPRPRARRRASSLSKPNGSPAASAASTKPSVTKTRRSPAESATSRIGNFRSSESPSGKEGSEIASTASAGDPVGRELPGVGQVAASGWRVEGEEREGHVIAGIRRAVNELVEPREERGAGHAPRRAASRGAAFAIATRSPVGSP